MFRLALAIFCLCVSMEILLAQSTRKIVDLLPKSVDKTSVEEVIHQMREAGVITKEQAVRAIGNITTMSEKEWIDTQKKAREVAGRALEQKSKEKVSNTRAPASIETSGPRVLSDEEGGHYRQLAVEVEKVLNEN